MKVILPIILSTIYLYFVYSENHEVFGNVKSLIMDEFVRQGYLEVVPQPNTDPQVKDIIWGQRAKHEFPKQNSLNFVSSVRHSHLSLFVITNKYKFGGSFVDSPHD